MQMFHVTCILLSQKKPTNPAHNYVVKFTSCPSFLNGPQETGLVYLAMFYENKRVVTMKPQKKTEVKCKKFVHARVNCHNKRFRVCLVVEVEILCYEISFRWSCVFHTIHAGVCFSEDT